MTADNQVMTEAQKEAERQAKAEGLETEFVNGSLIVYGRMEPLPVTREERMAIDKMDPAKRHPTLGAIARQQAVPVSGMTNEEIRRQLGPTGRERTR